MEISRDTFEGSDNSTQNLILFDSIKSLDKCLKERDVSHRSEHDKQDQAIKASGKVNRRISAGSGLFGGFIAVVMSKIFGL
jgi:hypothetical protein